jgi:hypothetical protein
VGWITLPRNLLEQQLDALGLEDAAKFETGIADPESLDGSENLNDYPDGGYDDHYVPRPRTAPIVSEGDASAAPSKTN